MELFVFFYLGVVGLIFGSFFNVVGLRIPKKQSIVHPRSSCPNCGRVLTSKELIPVFSYLIQRRKCRNCHVQISFIYPMMELLTGLLFAVTPLIIGWISLLFVAYLFISMLMIITVSDMAYMVIPDKILLFFLVVFIILHFFLSMPSWLDSIAGAVIGFGILFLIALISNGGLGGGDIKLFAVIGFILGLKLTLLALFFSIFYGAFIGLFLMGFGFVKSKQPVPFGPFITIGSLTAYFFGGRIVNWYFGVFI